MQHLPQLTCPKCDQKIYSNPYTPNKRKGAPTATSFEACLRICAGCGLAFSNRRTKDLSKLTIYYHDPFPASFPPWMREGSDRALKGALNELNRTSKRSKFHSHNSEDHVTWTVFRFLQHEGKLREVFAELGVSSAQKSEREPTLLLWGVPIPASDRGREIRKSLKTIMRSNLKEEPNRHSEPDVILDFDSAGVVFIEVKTGSGNDLKKPKTGNWHRYLPNTEAFCEPEEAKLSRLYELARNWRIAWDLAGSRPVTLINLAPSSLFKKKREVEAHARFSDALNQREDRRLVQLGWEKLRLAIKQEQIWLREYLDDRLRDKPRPPEGPKSLSC